MLAVAAVLSLNGCSSFNGERYGLVMDEGGQILVLACASDDFAEVEVWALNDGKVVGDDGDVLLASVGDLWEATGEVFQVRTGNSWAPGVGVGVTPTNGAPFAAELGDSPAAGTVVKFADGGVQSLEAFVSSCG